MVTNEILWGKLAQKKVNFYPKDIKSLGDVSSFKNLLYFQTTTADDDGNIYSFLVCVNMTLMTPCSACSATSVAKDEVTFSNETIFCQKFFFSSKSFSFKVHYSDLSSLQKNFFFVAINRKEIRI